MKLDVSNMRYMSPEDFRVLTAVRARVSETISLQFEMGSKNHHVVPTQLVTQISGLRSASRVHHVIGDLAKAKLISRERNAKYDGYKLTYTGYDYLALKTFDKRDSVTSVGTQIGVGKESDILLVFCHGQSRVMKVHRLGRISFRTVKRNRDYLKHRSSASWMYLSRIAAQREYAYMTALRQAGFSVPEPIDQSRHVVVMSLIDGIPMRQLNKHDNPARLYSTLMELIVELACQGLIHCDFNEFNILIREKFVDPKDEVVLIDFPQCISISHSDAARYFDRDVMCVVRFFEKKFNYAGPRPTFGEIVRRGTLDADVQASGFSKKEAKDFEDAMVSLREDMHLEDDDASGDAIDTDSSFEEHDEDPISTEHEAESIEYEEKLHKAILTKGLENLKTDRLGNYVLDEE